MAGFWGYYLCPNCALFRCLCESSGLIYSISRISEYLRLIKPECNATGAFPGRLYLFLSNPRLGIKWIQIFYHCVGRCWGVVIVFLYFLDVQVWVALLLAKAQWTESYQTYISNPFVTSKTKEEYSKIIRVVTTPIAIHITFNSSKKCRNKTKYRTTTTTTTESERPTTRILTKNSIATEQSSSPIQHWSTEIGPSGAVRNRSIPCLSNGSGTPDQIAKPGTPCQSSCGKGTHR